MARPPRRPARKRPASQPAWLDQAQAAVVEQREAEAGQSADLQAGLEQLLRDFDSALRDEPAVDNETRELIRQQFDVALRAAAANPAPEVPDRGTFMDALQALKASGGVAENEVDGLIRHIDQALQPLQRRESKLAIEFSRIARTEGHEKALAWFQQASKEAGAGQDRETAVPSRQEASPLLPSEVVNSRSSRPRGPPRRR